MEKYLLYLVGCCSTDVDILPYQEVWISQVPILCIRGCQNSPLLSHLLLQPGGLCFGCILVLFWLSFGCILVLFCLCFAVFWLCLDCITIVFSCVSCIWLKHFSAFSPPHFVSFPPLTCWRSFWLHFNCIYPYIHIFGGNTSLQIPPASSQLLAQPVPHRLY